MNYYLDTEFHEYKKKVFPWSKGINTIELISIGIIAEDGREYYAISKDFDLKAAWNSYQIEDTMPDSLAFGKIKRHWLRENVLKPIYFELIDLEHQDMFGCKIDDLEWESMDTKTIHYRYFKKLLDRYGRSNSQIAKEIIEFTHKEVFDNFKGAEKEFHIRTKEYGWGVDLNIEFYAYYADYDWVVLCWLFGRMIDLPEAFPMYCRDLKQMLDEKCDYRKEAWLIDHSSLDFDMLTHVKSLPDYPDQTNEHNAIADARWNKGLHHFIKSL